jgi:hypothetical protein
MNHLLAGGIHREGEAPGVCSAHCLEAFIGEPSHFALLKGIRDMAGVIQSSPRAATRPTVQSLDLPPWQPRPDSAATARGPRPPRGLSGSGWRDAFRWLLPWRERRFARRISRELLTLHRIVSARNPNLRGRDLYRIVVMARTRADLESAEILLDRAEESFAAWPAPRTLKFCDVVHFIAVSEFLASHGNSPWIHANMGREILSRIPDRL